MRFECSLFLSPLSGNGCDIGMMYNTIHYYKNHWRVNVLLWEYPGYGSDTIRTHTHAHAQYDAEIERDQSHAHTSYSSR